MSPAPFPTSKYDSGKWQQTSQGPLLRVSYGMGLELGSKLTVATTSLQVVKTTKRCDQRLWHLTQHNYLCTIYNTLCYSAC